MTKTMRRYLAGMMVSVTCTAVHAQAEASDRLSLPLKPSERPNIVLMLSDNLGYGDLGSYGGGAVRGAPTPSLDALANEGTRFTNFNVESECTPSRSALMTGRMPIRSGTTRAIPVPGLPVGLAPWEYTIAEMASDQGYDTAIFGKWHLGYVEERLPTNQGFDEWWGFPFSTDIASYPQAVGFDPKLFPPSTFFEGKKDGEIKALEAYNIKTRPFVDETIAQKSVAYIKDKAKDDKPFFLYIPWSLVHHPSIAHPDFQGKSGAGKFGDAMMEHDYRIQQVLDAIKEAGIEDNTLVIYASDNGPDRAEYPYIGGTGPYRGYLGTVHEGSIRTPLIMRWPDMIPNGRVTNEIVSINDIFPTIANIIGGEVPDDRTIDGIDQTNFFLGQQENSNRESVLFFAGDQMMAVKWRQFKIYLYGEKAEFERIPHQTGALWAPQAYNLELDPGERHDIGLQNLWLLAAALPPMFEYAYSVEEHGLLLPGGDEPEIFNTQLPFYTPEAMELALSSIKKDYIKKMIEEKLAEFKQAISGD
ncbi:arylsulfatase [Kistimonas asteriae]|uniref:arylsulfatase n=1 Tax=Kistimonas asteriae TaxID=517724 RepID=UPI001BA8F0F6|nr:arylsulfatase [Kistimonas asteriae]